MREHGIRARYLRRFKAPTDAKHSMLVAPNLLARNFTPMASTCVWTGDMTSIQTGESGLYLAIVLDLFNREMIGLVDHTQDDRQHRHRRAGDGLVPA
jgi:putative transposase